ncbi:MAG TPA: hypothetical protein VF756_00310 [Thermoanaerobaculia bacterium]
MSMSQREPSAPSAVVWSWRDREASAAQARDREASAARKRGLAGGVIGLAAAALIYFWWEKPAAAAVVAAIALVFTLLALLSPLGAHKTVARALDRFAYGVGTAVTWVLMTVLYYLLFLPLGLVLRARGRLGITRSFDPRRPSYWIANERTPTPESYRKQF